jgi:DnaK suppressor protein
VAKRTTARKTASKKGQAAAKSRPANRAKKPAKQAARRPQTDGEPNAARKPKARKKLLTAAQRRQFRKMLLEKRRELVGDMTGIEAEAFGADREDSKGDISDHPADAGTDNFEQEFSLGLLESERILLAEIDEALGRIEDRSYGICAGTGEPISKARLKARPWAKYSIEYARMVERGLVRPGEPIGGNDEDE